MNLTNKQKAAALDTLFAKLDTVIEFTDDEEKLEYLTEMVGFEVEYITKQIQDMESDRCDGCCGNCCKEVEDEDEGECEGESCSCVDKD
jgi:hypothetical protein